MTFHRRLELAPLRARGQSQLAVQRENSEIVTMRACWRTGCAISGFPEVVFAVHAFWRAPFRDGISLRRDIPNQPMREHPTRRIRIIGYENQTISPRTESQLFAKAGSCPRRRT